MKILQRYITGSLVTTFIITVLVLIGILCLGNLLKVADLILNGMAPWLILKFFGLLIVKLLQYAIPVAILTSTLLVFGRLSADNEITAMRSCGVGLSTIITPVIGCAVILTVFCLYLHNTAIPTYNYAIRNLRKQIGLSDPEILLELGEAIDLPGYEISIQGGKKDGFYRKVIVKQLATEDSPPMDIFAQKAEIITEPGQKGFTFKLYDGTISENIDRENKNITYTTFGELFYPIDLEEYYDENTHLAKRVKDMTRSELITYRELIRMRGLVENLGLERFIALFSILVPGRLDEPLHHLDDTPMKPGEAAEKISSITTELHKRLSLSVACLTFVLLAIPLAIKAHRGEKSIGMALSLAIIFVFYIFVAYARAVEDSPGHYPYLIIWFPNIVYGIIGITWITKFTKI